MSDRDELIEKTGRDVERLVRKEKTPTTLAGLVFYGGTLGLLFVVPIVAGAYLGRWLDTLASDYSARWTISLILLGIAIGGYNVYRFVRDRT